MITLFTGKTGSGKSNLVIKKILQELEQRKIITNIKINIDHPNYVYKNEDEIVQYIDDIQSRFANVKDFPLLIESLKKEQFYSALIIVDEAHLLGFRKKHEGIVNWLSVHRHVHQDIWLVTQTLKKIDAVYLLDVHYYYKMVDPHKRVNKNLIGYYKYDGVGGDRIETKYYRPDPQVFDIYTTGKADSSTNVFIWKLFGLVGFIFLALYLVYHFLVSSMTSFDRHIDKAKSSASSDLNTTKIISSHNSNNLPRVKSFSKYCTIKTKLLQSETKAQQIKDWSIIEPIFVKDSFTLRTKTVYKVYYKFCQTHHTDGFYKVYDETSVSSSIARGVPTGTDTEKRSN
jgi:zona occludens toxin (predicted ATPase)